MNKPSRISPHKVFQSWFNNTVYHLLVESNRGGEEGLKREQGLFNFLPLKRGELIRDRGLFERRGLNRGLTVAYDMEPNFCRFYGKFSLTDRHFCSAGSRPLDKEGARSSRPWDKRGGQSPKFFSALRSSVWSKNKGGQAPRIPPLASF